MKRNYIKLLSLICCTMISNLATAQMKYWGFQYANTLVHSPAGTSTLPLSPLAPTDPLNPVAHSVYDNSGQVLFTVTGSAIYDRTGTIVGGFPIGVSSELEVFPSGTGCGHYYILNTTGEGNGYTGPGDQQGLQLWEADASNPAAVTVNYVANLAGRSMIGYAQYSSVYNYSIIPGSVGNGNGLVATAVDKDNKRKLYLLSMSWDIGTVFPFPESNYRFSMKCWTFNPDGTYSFDYEQPLDFAGTLNPTPDYEYSGAGDKMSRVTIMEATPDGSKVAYGGAFSLKVYNTATKTITTYPMPWLQYQANMGVSSVNGVEWVPQLNRWYVSYTYLPVGATNAVGSIGYFEDGITTSFHNIGFTLPATFGASEIEYSYMDQKKLYFANCPTCTTYGGTGTYGDFMIGGGGPTPSPMTFPGPLYSFDPASSSPGATFGPVSGVSVKQSTVSGFYYYLNNQIDGEDYSLWNGISNVAGANMNDGVTIPYTPALCSTVSAYGTLQVVDVTAPLALNFRNSSGGIEKLHMNEEYYISWVETDACGVPLAPVFTTTHPWKSGPGPVDMKAYVPPGTFAGTPFFATTTCYNKYYGITVEVHNKCDDSRKAFKLWVKMQNGGTPCSAAYMFQTYSFNPNYYEIFPMTNLTGSTYMVDWGVGAGFVPITTGHLYSTTGTYTICLKEYRGGTEFCSVCKQICVGGTAVPDPTTCAFIFRGYSSSPLVREVIPFSIPPGSTILNYQVDWGDFSTPGTPSSSHLYGAPAAYRVCLSQYTNHPVSEVCETCTYFCVSDGSIPGVTRVAGNEQTAADAAAGKLYPNPAVNQATLSLELNDDANVHVTILDISGKTLQEVFAGNLPKGTQQIPVATDQLASGVYQVKAEYGSKINVFRLSVIK